MPAVNEEVPVKVAVNIHRDGKSAPQITSASGPKTVGPNMFSALANNRRIIPELPPATTQIFNPIAARPAPSDDDSSYLDGDDDDGFSGDDDVSEDSRGFRGLHEDAERTKAMKSECLQKLHRYAQQGYPVPEHLGLRSSLEELQGECDRIKRGIDTQNSIQFQRRMLVTFVTGCEYMNGVYDPVGMVGGPSLQLQGWSKNVMSEIDSFDAVFEELFEKYRNRVSMPPELQLFAALSMSAMACHMHNSGESLLRNNPMQAQPLRASAPPKPQPEPQPKPQPQEPPRQQQQQQPQPAETISRAAPDPKPYIMQGPPASGLGVLPAFAPVPIGPGSPALVAISVPQGSADDLLNPPVMQVPPRDPLLTIAEVPPSPTPSRGRKKAVVRRKRADAPSEAGVEL